MGKQRSEVPPRKGSVGRKKGLEEKRRGEFADFYPSSRLKLKRCRPDTSFI
jgi:hypothetical protein